MYIDRQAGVRREDLRDVPRGHLRRHCGRALHESREERLGDILCYYDYDYDDDDDDYDYDCDCDYDCDYDYDYDI